MEPVSPSPVAQGEHYQHWSTRSGRSAPPAALGFAFLSTGSTQSLPRFPSCPNFQVRLHSAQRNRAEILTPHFILQRLPGSCLLFAFFFFSPCMNCSQQKLWVWCIAVYFYTSSSGGSGSSSSSQSCINSILTVPPVVSAVQWDLTICSTACADWEPCPTGHSYRVIIPAPREAGKQLLPEIPFKSI